MAIEDKDVVAIEQFRGLRNTVDPSAFEPGDLAAAPNIDIDDALKPRRRKGYGSALFAGSYHSQFYHAGVWLAVTGGTLRRLHVNGTSATLRSGLAGERVDYATLGDRRIYYSDGFVTGCVDEGVARTWGLARPRQPAAGVMGGTLPAGVYQYALTFERSDGQESGTGDAGRIELTSSGGAGISFTSVEVPSDPTVVCKNLYLSPANGDELYLALRLEVSEVSAAVHQPVPLTAPLRTQHLEAPGPWRYLAAYNARIYGADGSVLRYTEAYAPELHDPRLGFEMTERITAIAPVRDGLYVGTTERLVFLPGGDPSKFEFAVQRSYGVLPGALAYANAVDIEPGASGEAVLLVTTQGLCACLNGGIIKDVTRDRFSIPIQERGAGAVRNHGGMVQYIAVLEGTEKAGNTAF